MSLKIDKARELVTKFPNTSKSELAKLLYKANKALFTDEENARSAIKRATGTDGKKNRRTIKATTYQEKRPSGIVYNPYELPDQITDVNNPYVIPVDETSILGIISDIHMPYQNNQALTSALDYLKKRKITHLYINGDLIDAYTMSTFDKDPGKKNWKYEVDVVRNFLKTLKNKFKGVKIILKEGNHDERFKRFMMRKAPELLGFEVFRLDILLGLRELDIDFVPSKQIAKAGDTLIVHGHEFGNQMFAPVNPARGFFMKTNSNVIGSHHHQISEYFVKTADGKTIRCYSTGHLGDESPDYRPFNNWSLGFADVTFEKNNEILESLVHNYRIKNGKVH